MSARIRFRPFLPSARIEFLPIFEKKHLILVDKKTFRRKTSSFWEKKNFFPTIVFLLVFFVALTLFKIGQMFLCRHLFQKFDQCFFIWSPSLTLPKICEMFFFPKGLFTALPH